MQTYLAITADDRGCEVWWLLRLLARGRRAGSQSSLARCSRANHRYSNLYRRVLSPAGKKAGVPWAGFHTLRHTCATRLFAEGRNAVQVQRWLGHHSPAFTLSLYVHLLDGDVGQPLALPLRVSAMVSAHQPETDPAPPAMKLVKSPAITDDHGRSRTSP